MNYNSSEEIVKRASQSDPIIMYLIVKKSLNMGCGKTAAQCAHASQMLLLKYLELKKGLWNRIISLFKPGNKDIDIFEKWLESSFRKVVLRADDKEFEKNRSEFQNSVVVVDAGLTEIEPGSMTVIGLFPMYKSAVPKSIKRLQTLK